MAGRDWDGGEGVGDGDGEGEVEGVSGDAAALVEAVGLLVQDVG